MQMKRPWVLAVLVFLTVYQQTYADTPEQPAKVAKERISDAVDRLIKAKDWRAAKNVKQELVVMGASAVRPIQRQAKRHENEQVRLWCYELLAAHFIEESRDFIADQGLSDTSEKVRYISAWHCGEAKIFGAHRKLRRLMEDENQPDCIRDAATKSLAELGETDVVRKLIELMSSDHYMARHMGNVGAKALTGRNLNDFNDYSYSEGALVSGGVEVVISNPYPPDLHEHIAERHQAVADYCRWLEKERPEVFKHLYAPF